MAADTGKGTRLRAKFPYTYKDASGTTVSFREGDNFTLIKKAGKDWWYVQQDGVGDQKPVYVPAKYMEELSPPPCFTSNGGSGLTPSLENVNEVPTQRTLLPDRDYDDREVNSVGSQGHSDLSSSSELLNTAGSSPQTPFDGPTVSNPSIDPPQPTRPPSQVLGNNWEVHYDDKGRKFFHNTISKESSWKPPRGYGVTSPKTTVPHGWKQETNDEGDLVYINEATKDKWHTSQDQNGKVYYYSDNGIDTAWELPEADPIPRSNTESQLSFEDSIRRNYIRPLNDRQSKTKSLVGGNSHEPDRRSATLPGSISGPVDSTFDIQIHRSFSDLAVHDTSVTAEKQGIVNKAKIFENGKKIKKNWSTSYLVLSNQHLYFYKDQKTASGKSGAPTGKPEIVAPMKGALIEWAKDKSSKKNVFQLSTLSGIEILVQCDNGMASQQWFTAITTNIGSMSPVPGRRQRSVDLSDEEELDQFPSRGMLLREDSQTKVGGKLKRLLSKRPKKEALEKKGYIKDRVFGSHLVQLCEKERSLVPKFVVQCIATIDKRGLRVDGIYRVSGNMSHVQKLRFTVDQEQPLNLNDPKWDDIHVIAGSLKLFFRELKEPLFPYKLFDRFVAAIKQDKRSKLKTFKTLLASLPKPNYETMRVLFQHLLRVIQHESYNRMNAQSIAIVFGPTLLWPETETGQMAINMVYQTQIVEFVLLEQNNLFPD
uniref:Rho GTPase-activating protein 12-like n=1 Tax=Saccoglossus kowalevskii TaxID=10224 RepID=A0ABM0MYT1_SACKO|nr:PREDICTED: rho GTPase-activating protein 12-like [Saccoglossus kowalevskii]